MNAERVVGDCDLEILNFGYSRVAKRLNRGNQYLFLFYENSNPFADNKL